MNTKPRVHAMIVAAGRGSRFGASLPKQYLLLQGQTLLQHSVARLSSSSHINECLLVLSAEDNIAQTLDFSIPVQYTIGGEERWQSVSAGLEAIMKSGADADDLVLIHDAARPTVPHNDIEQVIKAAMLEPYGAILATPVADTLKQSQIHSNSHITTQSKSNKATNSSQYYVNRTIERNDLWQAQTPQVFRICELYKALVFVTQNRIEITDEASAFEYLDLPIRLVNGSRQNIKLTYPDDAALLQAILIIQKENDR